MERKVLKTEEQIRREEFAEAWIKMYRDEGDMRSEEEILAAEERETGLSVSEANDLIAAVESSGRSYVCMDGRSGRPVTMTKDEYIRRIRASINLERM